MRIVYVLTSIGVGGAERQVISLATGMARRGHAVALLILRPRHAEEWPTSLPVTSLEMRKTLLSFLAGMRAGRQFLADFSPDIVHSHGFHANIAARLLKLLTPKPAVISTVHNVYEGGWRRMLAYRITDGLSQRTTGVSEAVVSRFIQLRAVPRHKCKVVCNAFELEKFIPQPDSRARMRAALGAEGPAGQEFVWLAVGRIAPAKDYPNLLRAFAAVHQSCPNARLWIAGDGFDALSQSVRSLANQLKVEDFVRWLGLRRDIPALLDASDAFVQGSAWEGMPLAIGEAMAMEKAVVATDVGGVRELVGNAGILVPAGDAQALAASMLGVMEAPLEKRQTLGAAARARIEQGFSMDRRIAEWETIYESLLQQ